MRTFIAIDLDEDIKKALSQLINRLIKVSKDVKWIKKDAMHLTLKFLGEISQEKVYEIEKILKEISKKHGSFSLKIKGTGYFPSEKKIPRVLWIGVDEEKTLESLQNELDTELERVGFPREMRKFHPHLTLGRVKGPSGIMETLRELENNRNSSFGEMIVKSITFFQSTLKPSGAEYSVLSEFKLE